MDELRLLTWNPHVGNRPRRVRRALLRWIRRHRPDVIVVTEARRFAGVLETIPGYRVFQETPVPKARRGTVDDRGDTAVLVHESVTVHRRKVARMRSSWLVWRYRRRHTPRRYEVLTLTVRGRRWKVRGSHWPTNGLDGVNRAAFLESAIRSKLWALACRVPTVDAGDLNEQRGRLARWFGRGFTVRGHRIDLVIARRVRGVRHWRLAKNGSDHHGQAYTLAA